MRRRLVRSIVGLFVVLAGRALAAPPPNDDCANAVVVTSLPFVDTLSTAEATQAPTDPAVCGSGGGPTVWYRVEPPTNGDLCIRTCGGTSYDSVLSAHYGTCGDPGPAYACNDDYCDLQSRITAVGAVGYPILIEVSRYGSYNSSVIGGALRVEIVQAGDNDGDGIDDCFDNCAGVANHDQADLDGDEIGDVCDACLSDRSTFDNDEDGYCVGCALGCDNCTDEPNPDQIDSDGDGYGDACDNCDLVPNPFQEDSDADGIGNACDPCPIDGNPSDVDGDGYCSNPTTCPAGCDLCPYVADPAQEDTDGDGVGDACDNCPTVPNPDQRNWDADPLGNACDPCIEICGGTQCAASGCYDIATDTCTPSSVLPDGTPCNDFDVCTTVDTCHAGVCTGPPFDCGTANACRTNPTCVPFSGCTAERAPNGTPCDDGDHCTTDDECKLGTCLGLPRDNCPFDQYKCYRSGGGKPLADTVTYTDAFGTATVARQPASHLCNAATDGDPIEDGNRHLTCWRAKQTAPTPRRSVKLEDRFGSGTFTLTKPIAYCAGSEELLDPATIDRDELACYRARGPKRPIQSLTLADQFETRATSVLKPYSVCVPASRDGASLVDAGAKLVCYKLKEGHAPAFETHGLTVSSALGGEALRTTRRRLLCVPAAKAPCKRLTFTSVPGSPQCGGTEFNPPASPPFVGGIYDAPAGGFLIWNLGSGCTYFGGGDSEYYPARQQVTGATLTLEADTCEGSPLDLHASAGTGFGDCAFGPAGQRVCLTDTLRACTSDAECSGASGSCAPVARCYAAPPQPFRTNIASVCLMSPLDADTTGTIDPATGELTIATTTRTLVYLTGFGTVPYPCPRCLSNVCNGGQRDGLACTVSASPDQTSLDCPPSDNTFFLSLGPGTATNSTTPRTMVANASGLFCPNQVHAGAFGVPVTRRIELGGIPAGDLTDGQPHPVTLLDLVCVGSTGTPAADQLADFPGPQATSIAGEVQLTE
jgi:hypothetical protein